MITILLFVIFSFSVPVHAGILSFFNGLLGGEDNGSLTFKNSQNLALLRAALNPDPNPAKGGGDINIVDGSALVSDNGPLGTRGDSEIKPKSEQVSVYVVREGDSLSQIAKMFGVSIDTIIWANDIKKGNLIKEGQTLVILPISGIEHTIVKGDTLAKIASKYKAEVEEILSFNEIPEGYTL